MPFERIKTEIGLLLTAMQNEPRDAQELAFNIHEKLREFAAYGMPPPQDLVDLEAALVAEFEQDRLRMR